MRRFLLLIILAAVCIPSRAQFNELAVPDYYLQYVPIAADLGLGAIGLQIRHNALDRFITAGIGVLAETAIVNTIKFTVDEQRPDGSAHNSFPSGHTATAFVGAELVRHEYGWGWGAGAYAVATGVAALRVYHKRHYWWDTLAGAGCGILSANIGYWLLNPVHRLFGIDADSGNLSLSPMYDPMSGAVGPYLAIKF